MKPHLYFRHPILNDKGYWLCKGRVGKGGGWIIGRARSIKAAYNDFTRNAKWHSQGCPGAPWVTRNK